MRNISTDLLASQLTTAFIKSGLTTAQFVQHIIDTRGDTGTEVLADASVTDTYASIEVGIPAGEYCDGEEFFDIYTFYKHHDSNHWGCKL